MKTVRNFLFLLFFQIFPWVSPATEFPVIYYCYSNSTSWPASGVCSPEVKIATSTFMFGKVFENNLNVEDVNVIAETAEVLVLRCRAPYPIRWIGQKPIGKTRLLENHGNHGFQSSTTSNNLNYAHALSVRFKSGEFSRVFRCESYLNKSLASELYLNTPSKFLKSLEPKGVTQTKMINFLDLSEHIEDSKDRVKNITLPCVAKAIPGYLMFTQPDISSDAFQYMNLVLRKKDAFQASQAAGTSSYDPKVGFRVEAITTELTQISPFQCTSRFHPSPEWMIPVSSMQKLPAEISYRTDADGKLRVQCSIKSNATLGLKATELYVTFGACRSILECDLKWKPLAPQIFSTVETAPDNYEFQRMDHEQILPAHPNGIRLEQRRGFIHCIGITHPNHTTRDGQSLEYVSEIDYVFTGLNGKGYLVSKLPTDSSIELKEVGLSAPDNEMQSHLKMVTFECRISTFVILPNIYFTIDSDWPHPKQLFFSGQRYESVGVKIYKLRSQKHKDIAVWQIKFPISIQMNRITCHGPRIDSTEMVAATVDLREKASYFRSQTGPSIPTEAIIVIAILVVVVLILAQWFLWRKYKFALREIRNLTKEEVDEFYFGNVKPGQSVENIPLDSLPFVQNKIIQSEHLKTDAFVLGEGEFGVVHKGQFNGEIVAIKSSKSVADIEYFKAFLKEIKVMAFVSEHKNIIKFFGAVVDKIRERVCSAVIELSPFGDLQKYLRTNSKIYTHDNNEVLSANSNVVGQPGIQLNYNILVSFCRQIAEGMEFLATKQVLHGDLATRNVLVFNDNIVKITDFGLSRKLYNCANYVKTQQTPLPWRWMAPESLRYFDFSTKSDVWSYGVTMWEIFSLAQVPFAGINWTTDFADNLEAGYRLTKPQHCTQLEYEWMLKCWGKNPEDRPTFNDCKRRMTPDVSETNQNIETTF